MIYRREGVGIYVVDQVLIPVLMMTRAGISHIYARERRLAAGGKPYDNRWSYTHSSGILRDALSTYALETFAGNHDGHRAIGISSLSAGKLYSEPVE